MSDLPSFLLQTGPHSYTLTISASAAECFMLCPAKYSWSRVTEIEAATPRAGMNYGKAMHLLLAARYSGEPYIPLEVVEQHFQANPQPAMGRKGRPEWRTQARALQAFAAYRERYPAEDFEVLGVEEPFEVTLGEFPSEQERLENAISTRVTVVFRGIRDLRVRWHDRLWVLDHKTSTEWSDLTVDEGKCSFQFMGYAWVERLLAQQESSDSAIECLACRSGILEGEQCPMCQGTGLVRQFPPDAVGGVIGNYLIAREPYAEGYKPRANSLPRDQFERIPYPYTDQQLDEWHGRAMRLAKAIFAAWQSEEWDQHSTACAHWGRCEYYQLCWETEPAYRLAAALSGDYRKRTPSPLDEEASV